MGVCERCVAAVTCWRDELRSAVAMELGVVHPGSVRVYRQKERSDREIRKRDKRAKRRADKKRQANLKQR